MKICFPVSRENDGQPYQATDDKSLQAMLAKLRSEPNGAWLVGANGLWHGGVHLSDRASAPYAKLTPDLLQQNKVMPLRCMAEGEVVAYRLNKAYLEAPYFRDEQLKYSSTFALVKSEYKAQDETLLTFYSLYMHLAPVSDYPAYPRYRAIVQHTLNTHRFTANNEEQYGIPSDVTERGERRDYDIPPTNGSLKHGDEFLVYQTADFFMTTIISTRYDKVRFGLAQKLEGGVVKDKKKFWVELDPQFVEQTGEACPQMPVWMQTAVKKGAFDSVQTLMGDEVIRINAGDPIGHLGLFESPAARLPDRMSYYFTHIEVLSADDNLPDFVNNTKRLADGRKYVTCGFDQLLHSYDATHKTFTPLKVRTQQEIVLAKALTSPVKDKNGVNWYKVTQTGWVKQNGELVTEVDQHDLNKLGFRLLEEEATTDFSKLTAEECVKVLLCHLLAVAKQDRRIDHALVPVRYERILRKLDKDGDGQLNAQEVRLGLYNPEMINVVTRFIVKHSSEWYENSQGGPWENFFTNVVKNRTANKFWRQYLDDQVWMKEVEPFSSGKPVWHMHPVVFLDALKCEEEKQIIFPLTVKPENDPGHKWSHYDWRDIHQRNMAAFGTNRSGGKRKHAARDLYTNPHEKVVAICDGIVLDVHSFYSGTYQVTVKHTTKDGRNFIIRYGELDPNSIKVGINERIKQNQHIGSTGRLLHKDGSPVLKLNGNTVFMLHFEYYTGDDGLNINHSLTDRDNPPFIRRRDLSDPLNILDEGYRSTFQNNNCSDNRLNVNGLFTSEKGKNFIKSWESLELEAYNDVKGFCTIGYGHLIQKKNCEDINLPVDLQGKITKQKADEIFSNDLLRFENAVKQAIFVNLYQNEFDALVSLLFNCGENFFVQKRAPNLVKLLNNRDYVEAAEEFLDITNGGISGLVNRRRAEYDIFLIKKYNFNH